MIKTFKRFLLLSLSLSFLASSAFAQPAGARGDNFIYIVQRNDTVALIAERFTSKPSHWRAIRAYNRINNVHAIPVGKQILIPFKYIDTIPEYAQVSSLVGEAYLDDQPLHADQRLQESQVIRTTPNSSVTLSFANGSTISIAPNSLVTIQRLRSFSGTGLIDAIFNAQVGSFTADVNVNTEGVGRFEIRTPVSITGVRGTKIRNHVDAQGNTTVELLRGKTDISTNQRPNDRLKLGKQQGINITQGALGTPLDLLPAPMLQAQVEQAKQELSLQIQAVEQAQQYLVRYTLDQDGMREIARHSTQELNLTLPLPQNVYRFYVQARSINQQGMGGSDQAALVVLQSPTETDSTVDKKK